MDARRLAVDALLRIDDGAYANLVVPSMLTASSLPGRDRAFVTELVYGTTRMRRACDWLVDRYLIRAPDPETRALLRLGAYQLVFLGTPPHAAVSATVNAGRRRATRGLINAVLRRVAESLPVSWPDRATALSYPDWIIERLTIDLGEDAAVAALEQMNHPAQVHEREDTYVQDPASQEVARYVGVGPGERVLDACAAPGGKATLMAAAHPVIVAAADRHPARTRLVLSNASRTGAAEVGAVCADSRRGPWAPSTFDRILVDAPCSGLGVLGRRPDARWRVQPEDVDALAILQRELLAAQMENLRPGGLLVYSVCTLTAAETTAIAEWLTESYPDMTAMAPPGTPWERLGRGARLLPQSASTDGMFVVAMRRAA